MELSAGVQSSTPVEQRKDFPAAYGNWFDVVAADTPELLDRAYRLRYQVYCRERGFEDASSFPEQKETDLYDAHAVHSVIISRYDDSVLGTVRLVLPDASKPDASFSMQDLCRHAKLTRTLSRSFSTTAEISRFAIAKATRKLPAGTGGSVKGRMRQSDEKAGITRPSIVLGLMRAIVRMSRAQGITEWLAVMEPSLLRHLARFAIYFQPVGPLVEYHGMRQPSQANIRILLERMRKERPDVWAYITDGGYSPETR
jgi:N-acyl amino acid synthase of PEP-CTERM/exosortase system